MKKVPLGRVKIWDGFEFKLTKNKNWCCVLNEGSNDQVELSAMPIGDGGGGWTGQISLTHDDGGEEECYAYGYGRGFKSCLNKTLANLRRNTKHAQSQLDCAQAELEYCEDQHSQLSYLLFKIGGEK